MIRVLLVEDSPIAMHVLQRLLARTPDIQVVGTATNGAEALELLSSLQPDVICTDIYMPVMNGLEFTRHVMVQQPTPILVVSVSVEPGSPNVFKILEAGAIDVYPKPFAVMEADQESIAKEFASKIRVVAGVHVISRTKKNGTGVLSHVPTLHIPINLVVIGASTGGPQALREILSHLPNDFSVPVVCVQHIGDNFLPEMVTWLNETVALPVSIAKQGDIPKARNVYFASSEGHLEFDENGCFYLSSTLPCDGHKPSVTVTFRAAAHRYGAGVLGVLLTGMGRDGADGMAKIAAKGGMTIAQDEASSIVYGMPKEAVALGVVQHILPLEKIAPTLVALVKK